MTREEHLKFCKVCVNQKKDLELGIVCGLHGGIADFKDECASFEEDMALRQKLEDNLAISHMQGKLASQGQRFANYLIDRVFLFGLAAIIGTVIGVLLMQFFPEYEYILDIDNRLVDYTLGLVIGIIYYSFFEGFTGRSLGKFFTKTKVVTEEGHRPDFKTIFIRSICRYIPFDAISFLGSGSVGWHDSISKTRVVGIDY